MSLSCEWDPAERCAQAKAGQQNFPRAAVPCRTKMIMIMIEIMVTAYELFVPAACMRFLAVIVELL